jgi:hypothetical protein
MNWLSHDHLLDDEPHSHLNPFAHTSPRVKRWGCGCLAVLILLVAVVSGVVLIKAEFIRCPLYRYFVTYPKYEESLESLAAQIQPPPKDGWQDFRCVVHAHSYLSHDSNGTPEQIVAAAKKVGIEAVFMTDHPTQDNRQLTEALIGDVSGVLFFPGYETGENMGIFPGEVTGELRAVVQHRPLKHLFDNILERGGLVIYPHPEMENRRWDLLNFQGMEIYNIHTDAKDMLENRRKLLETVVDSYVSGGRYPFFGFRLFFDEPTEFLERWDGLNSFRRVFGAAGNDAHQNTSVALKTDATGELGFYSPADDPKPLKAWDGLIASLASVFADDEGLVWFVQLDPYEVSYGYVNTYMLATERTTDALFEALREGRCYVAFGGYLDPRGFRFDYVVGDNRYPMGSETPFAPGGVLAVRLPLATETRILRDGEIVETSSDSKVLTLDVDRPGTYRVEARIEVNGESWPWIYSNPIRIVEDSSESKESTDDRTEQ